MIVGPILAIDPGPKESAYVLYDGRVKRAVKVPNDALLEEVKYVADASHMAIEMIQSFGMPVGAEVFETCWWIGRFCQAWHPRPFARINRLEVKTHLCHSARAKDGNVRQALIDRLGSPGTKKAPGPTYGLAGDMWSALAVAITFLDTKAGMLPPPEDKA